VKPASLGEFVRRRTYSSDADQNHLPRMLPPSSCRTVWPTADAHQRRNGHRQPRRRRRHYTNRRLSPIPDRSHRMDGRRHYIILSAAETSIMRRAMPKTQRVSPDTSLNLPTSRGLNHPPPRFLSHDASRSMSSSRRAALRLQYMLLLPTQSMPPVFDQLYGQRLYQSRK
jgi:hypothetical protein